MVTNLHGAQQNCLNFFIYIIETLSICMQ